MHISHAKHLRCKKAQPSKVESYLEMNTWTDWQQQDLISECGQGLVYWTYKYYISYTVATIFKFKIRLYS